MKTRRKKKLKLNEVNFFMANNPGYLANNQEVKKALIDSEKEHMPRECLECIFFGWVWEKDEQIAGCSICDRITFDYGKRAAECPLDGGSELVQVAGQIKTMEG